MIATVTLNPSLDEWIRLPALKMGALNRTGEFVRYPGGKGINVSRVVYELGGTTQVFGLSGGGDGDLLQRLLQDMRIDHCFVQTGGNTRNNYKILTEQPKRLTEINTAGPKVLPAELSALKTLVLKKTLKRTTCVALSGSLPPGAPATTYQEWIRALRRNGVATVLDTSGEALREGVKASPDWIKPNRDEASELLGRKLRSVKDAAEAAQALLETGPESVVLSLGDEGMLLASRSLDAVWHALPIKVKADSAVGAGDSVVGGIATGLARGQSLLEAFRLGAACGTATVITPGTELCHRKDVEHFLPNIRLRKAGN